MHYIDEVFHLFESSYVLLKVILVEKDFPQSSHGYGFSLVWVNKCVFKILMVAKYLSHVLHWWGFHPYESSYVLLNCYCLKKTFHKHCIDKTFHLYESSYVLLKCLWLKKAFHKHYTDILFPHCESPYELLHCYCLKKTYHIHYIVIGITFHLWESLCSILNIYF